MKDRQTAILLMVVSVFSFSVMQLIVKLSGGDIPMYEQVFARNFMTLFVALAIMAKEGRFSIGGLKNQPALCIRSVLGYIGVVGYFYASRNMFVADATLLHRSSPFFVIIFSAIFLKQPITKLQIFALLLSAVGAVIVIDPQMNSSVWPSVVALLSAVGAGGAYTAISFLRGKESNGTIMFHFSLLSCVLSLVSGWSDFVVPQGVDWLMLIGIGVCATVGQYTLTKAYKLTNPGDVSIINYLGIIFSGVLGFLFLGEMVKLRSVIGMLMIFAAALSLYFGRGKKPAQPQRS